jgi:hypothetical protein
MGCGPDDVDVTLPGPCPEGCIVLTDHGQLPYGIAVHDGTVYWTEGGIIYGAKLNGERVFSTYPGTRDRLDAFAVTNTTIFAGGIGPGGITSYPLGGGPPTALLAAKSARPVEMAVDGSFVFWTEYSGRVLRASLSGADVTTLADGQVGPMSIVVHDGFVYWANSGTVLLRNGYWVASNDGAIMRVPISGGAPTTIAAGLAPPGQIGVDGVSVYWGSGDNMIRKAPVGGGASVILASGQPTSGALAVDATNVYWSNFDGRGTIMRAELATGKISRLASHQSIPYRLVADGRYVYWTDPGGAFEDLSGHVVAIRAPR